MSASPQRHSATDPTAGDDLPGVGVVPADLPPDPHQTYNPEPFRAAISRQPDDVAAAGPPPPRMPTRHVLRAAPDEPIDLAASPEASRPDVEHPSSIPWIGATPQESAPSDGAPDAAASSTGSDDAHTNADAAADDDADSLDTDTAVRLSTALRGPNDTLPDTGVPEPGTPAAQHGFEMEKIIGRGGVGEVWEARQLSLGRQIAVKKLRDDFYAEHREQLGEVSLYEDAFRQEALTTGFLEHPNIVPVYDFAYDAKRHPLLAMKLVNGRPWSKMLREDFVALSSVELLARHLPILIDVAQAVAFAHSRGVIHRDIKPAQVMVGEFGEVLLMDWGLAVRYRDIDPNESGEVVMPPSLRYVPSTMTASSPSGTPAYMAPEQTEKSGRRLGPWTDVFLLGGTLYHLLTATPPHQSASSISAFTSARQGKVDPPRVRAPHRDIPLPLSELCLHAMAAEPEKRLQSAREFIRGLEDYMSGATRRRESQRLLALAQRGLARSATPDYNRFSRLNDQVERAATLWPENPDLTPVRDSVLGATADAAIDNKDLVLARVVAERMTDGDQRRTLVRRIEDAEDILRGNEERVHEMHLEVQRQRDRAEDLLNFLLVDLHANLKPLGRLDLLEQIALKSVDYYAGYQSVEKPPDAVRRHGLALRLAGDVLRDQGQLDAALQTYEHQLALARELRRRAPDSPVGDELFAEAQARIGQLRYEQRDLVRSQEAFEQALPIRQRIAERHPDQPDAVNELAWVLEGLGVVHRRSGRLEEALEAHEQAIAMRERIVARQPDHVKWIADLTWSLNSRAVVLAQLGRREEAMATLHRAVPMRRRLVELDTANATYQRNLAWTIGSVGKLYLETGRPAEAIRAYLEAIEILRAQARHDPTNDRLARDMAWSLGSLGFSLEAMGDLVAAERALAECGEIQQRIAAKDASHQSVRHEFAWSVIVRAAVLAELGRLDAARRCVGRGLEIRREWNERDPSAARNQRDLTRCHLVLAWIERAAGNDDAFREEIASARASFCDPQPNESGAVLLEAQALQAMLLLLEGEEDRAHRLARSLMAERCVIEAPFRTFFGRPVPTVGD